MISQTHRTTLWALVVTLVLIGTAVNRAHAEQISLDSAFGPDTITLDSATGLKWLDVTLSTPYTYDEILVELGPGGTFNGFRLATRDEVLELWQNAGINVGAGFSGVFTSENFQPIVNLMALVGVTGPNSGALEGGNRYDFTTGHIESGGGGAG